MADQVMSRPAPHVVPIFATPFGVVSLPEAQRINPSLAALFAERATSEWRDPHAPAAPHAFRSRDDLTEWPEEPVPQVIRGIIAGVSSVAASINELGEEQWTALRIQARAWFTIVRPDGCVPATNYPNSSWLAVYCVAAPEPSKHRSDSGVLRMYETRLGAMFADPSSDSTRLPYRSGHCTWRPVPGQMAVLPASISHEIAVVRAAGTLVLVNARVRFVGSSQTGVPW